jgi:hypothetical protein
MASSDLRRNIGLGTIDATATGSVIGGPGWAKAFGRRIPDQGGNILGEVVGDLWAADDIGIAFPAGTLWVRQAAVYSAVGGSGYDDDDQYWVAVPATLPGGYTYTPRRNLPYSTVAIGSSFRVNTGGLQSGVTYAPSYSPTAPIRTANGIYTPLASTVDMLGVTTSPTGRLTSASGSGRSTLVLPGTS